MNTKDFFDNHLSPNIMEKAPLDYEPPILVMMGRDRDCNPILSISQVPEEKAFISSVAIDVTSYDQKTLGFRYDLKLKEDKFKDIFFKVVDDILCYAANETDRKKYARGLIDRYKVWCKFWKRNRTTLTREEKQGLFGELLYIRDNLKKGKDPDCLLRSWKGPEGSPQDFIETGSWTEIKTIKHTFDSISISSLEQLDNPAGLTEQDSLKVKGRLIVYKLNLSPATPSPLKLTSLVDELENMLSPDSAAHDLLENGLELIGFDKEKEKEDDFVAELFSVSIFDASAPDFPKYRVKDVNNAVIGMTYELSIPGLVKWKVEE